jgi:phage terminase large subunit GpA-like protein
MLEFEREQREWLATQFDELTTELSELTPSIWAEQKRYLPPSVTSLPGYYRFEVAPYLREIVDCFSIDSPIREVSVMKGAQLGFTVGVLENVIGYLIDYVKTAPVMFVTADAELAKLRMESNITPMLQHSGLEHLVKSADERNTRKTGKTDKKIEWTGGGYLVPFGAQNANKLRSVSIQVLLCDEIDSWPANVGKDGDPLLLVTARTSAYESSRKIGEISTPLILGSSRIAQRFERGDQRRYFVNCLKCGHAQTLRWRRENAQTGERTGIVWDTDEGRIVPGSVRYLCEQCAHPHTNDDKTRLLSPDNGAEWRPTAQPASPHHRSYHVNALYSPVGMRTWEAMALAWQEAWDDARNRLLDPAKLQVFYNNDLGEPYELRGERVRFQAVSGHRRNAYHYGQIPNRYAIEHCGGPVHLLICSVDVHGDSLRVSVWGWCRDSRAILVDYERFDGDPSQLDDAGTWGRLRELIGSDDNDPKEYTADDGTRYRVMLTVIDSGYLTDQVYRFAGEYPAGVAPVKGREDTARVGAVREFQAFETPNGVRAYLISVDLYKDRWSAALRREWDGSAMQPVGHFNAPIDTTDKQLKELTAEVKVQTREGAKWHRTSGVPNELFDLLIYSSAGLDFVAHDVCTTDQLYIDNGPGQPPTKGPLEYTNAQLFWQFCEQQRPYVVE